MARPRAFRSWAAWLGLPPHGAPYDPQSRWVTSYVLPPAWLAGVRLLLGLYACASSCVAMPPWRAAGLGALTGPHSSTSRLNHHQLLVQRLGAVCVLHGQQAAHWALSDVEAAEHCHTSPRCSPTGASWPGSWRRACTRLRTRSRCAAGSSKRPAQQRRRPLPCRAAGWPSAFRVRCSSFTRCSSAQSARL